MSREETVSCDYCRQRFFGASLVATVKQVHISVTCSNQCFGSVTLDICDDCMEEHGLVSLSPDVSVEHEHGEKCNRGLIRAKEWLMKWIRR